jgi:NADH-quinone oxidoreductase subunit L
MYQAIVFLPLLGFLLAGAASMLAWKLGSGVAAWGAADHSGHAHHHADHGHDDHHAAEPSPHSEAVNRFAEIVTTGLLFVSCALSWVAFFRHGFGNDGNIVVPVANWISSGALQVQWALKIDTLTAMMLIVVTTVSAVVHLYSIGYMHEDPHRPRFFAYLSLFTFAMLMLVTSDNLVQMFFGWEGSSRPRMRR